ncbi:hypothetical protein ACFQU7_11980 [Pseudoroseomonas wenyumeiae]
MRKALIVFLVLVLLAAGGAWWAREQYVAPGPWLSPPPSWCRAAVPRPLPRCWWSGAPSAIPASSPWRPG